MPQQLATVTPVVYGCRWTQSKTANGLLAHSLLAPRGATVVYSDCVQPWGAFLCTPTSRRWLHPLPPAGGGSPFWGDSVSAPVRLETSVWSDTRFDRLARMSGRTRFDCVGRMALVWAEGTNRETDVLHADELEIIFESAEALDWLIAVGLAVDAGNDSAKLSGGDRLSWLGKKRKVAKENGKKGGRPATNVGTKPKPTSVTKKTHYSSGSGSGSVLVQKSSSPAIGIAPDPSTYPASAATVRVIGYFNRKAKKSARPPTHNERVNKLIKAGFTETEINVVVWHAVERWGEDAEMSKYIRPATLFRPKNTKGNAFPDYLEEAVPAWEAKTGNTFERSRQHESIPTEETHDDQT